MIKRLSGRSSGSLIANPKRSGRNRRKGRKSAHRGKRRSKGKSLAALLARNPGRFRKSKSRKGHRKARNPRSLASYSKSRKRSKSRNPSIGGLDVVEVGAASLITIGAGSIGQALFDKYLGGSITNDAARKAAPAAIVAVASYFLGKKVLKGAKAKKIAHYVTLLSAFKAVDDAAGETVRAKVTEMLPDSLKGAYLPTSGGGAVSGRLAGAFVDATGGAYMPTNGVFPKTNLYGL